jgi:hypothetical protein
MTPEELAARHPYLYHVTTPGAWALIEKLGLLSSTELLRNFGYEAGDAQKLTAKRRPAEVPISCALHGNATLNDNSPLNEAALAKCLDDGLTPDDWLSMLNARVFFWADRNGLARLMNAQFNRGRAREVLVFDTLGLASAHARRMELSPINSGATIRKPARRGFSTFTPLLAKRYPDWRKQRGGNDKILEITVTCGVPDIARYLVSREIVNCPT